MEPKKTTDGSLNSNYPTGDGKTTAIDVRLNIA